MVDCMRVTAGIVTMELEEIWEIARRESKGVPNNAMKQLLAVEVEWPQPLTCQMFTGVSKMLQPES
jgi:hypothetical protein